MSAYKVVGVIIISLVWISLSISKLDYTLNYNESSIKYNITIDGRTWLESGYTGFHINNNWISTLKLISKQELNGTDSIGDYNEVIISFYDGIHINNTMNIHFKSYPNLSNILILSQSFPNGLFNTKSKSMDDIITSFPSFIVKQPSELFLGWYHFAGNQATSLGSQSSTFDSNGLLLFKGGIESSGPLVIFDEDLNNSIVISSLTYSMSTSQYKDDNKKEIQWGLQGLINQIEPGFTVKFIISASNRNNNNTSTQLGINGVNSAMKTWGKNVLKYFNRDINNGNYGHDRDYTLNYLGYSTDNGAFYYYWTEINKTYQETLIDIYSYHQKNNIPTKYILMDSWWYYKDSNGGGILNWTAPPSIFPDGLQYVSQKLTKWKFQAHSKYFSQNTVYANNLNPVNNTLYNGSTFQFTAGAGNRALPLTISFWDYLFDINSNWNLIVYEQDWIEQTSDNMPLILNTTQFGQDWLLQMGKSANNHDINIQYCSAYPRHLITAAELLGNNIVTQTRASGDYHPANDYTQTQWQIGVSSIFVTSLGLSPSKDSFWSTNIPQTCKYGTNIIAKYVELNAAVLSLSNGPYTFADQIGYSNFSLIMKCCNSDGLILRPDKSATMIDKFFLFKSAVDLDKPVGQIWTTYSIIGDNTNNNLFYKYYYVLAAVIPDIFTFEPYDLSYHFNQDTFNEELNQTWLVYNFRDSKDVKIFNNNNKLEIDICWMDDFSLFTLIPIRSEQDSIWYVQGELDKWINISKQRFLSIDIDFNNGETIVVINGGYNETVNIAFINPKTMQQVIVSCVIDTSLQKTISMPQAVCS